MDAGENAAQRRAGMNDKTILITGAAGQVGTALRHELRNHYRRLRLADLQPVADLQANEEAVICDVTQADQINRAMQGVDAVVHLAGYPVEGSWEQVVGPNLMGNINTWEAARSAGVKRMVYASTNHAVGFYPRSRTIDDRVMLRPDGRYGATKAFGELLAAMFWDKHGIASLCIRIGNINLDNRPLDRRRLSIWVSWRDLAQLVRIGIEHPEIAFNVVYGISGNKRAWYDNREAFRLGYKPHDDAETFAAEILAREPQADPTNVSQRMMGGDFCGMDYEGDPGRPEQVKY
jgi:uronate dehydrogenase